MRIDVIDDAGSKIVGKARGQDSSVPSPIWGSCGRQELFSFSFPLRGAGDLKFSEAQEWLVRRFMKGGVS